MLMISSKGMAYDKKFRESVLKHMAKGRPQEAAAKLWGGILRCSFREPPKAVNETESADVSLICKYHLKVKPLW